MHRDIAHIIGLRLIMVIDCFFIIYLGFWITGISSRFRGKMISKLDLFIACK